MKNQIRRSKSQDSHSHPFDSEVTLTILLTKQKQITIPIPVNCPFDIINSILTEKISQYQQGTVIGFESVPTDYSFDYKLSKNLGSLTGRRNVTLKCLCQRQSAQKNILIDKTTEILPFDLQLSYFKKIAKYKLCKPLSSGGFSRVYLVRNMQNGQFYAAKFMEKASQVNSDREEAIQNEFLIHKSLNNPFIVKMQEYFETDYFYVLIMEYCPGGQLFTLLKNNRYMSEDKAKVIFIQVLIAIKYLHERNIVFRDIKPENILIDAFGNAKVTDFGLAKQIRGKTNSYCGSVEYMAPEIVSKKSYSFDVDLYCIGALLYEILIGCPPFYNPNFTNNETKYHICNSEVSFPRKVVISNLVKQLIAELLVKDPKQRLGHNKGVDEILEHQWIGQISIEKYLNGEIKNPFVPNLDVENFDRQQDQNQLLFRNKIIKELKKCQSLCTEMENYAKNRQSMQSKIKSQSLALLPKKHQKSKSQNEFILIFQKKNQLNSLIQNQNSFKKMSNRQSPYAIPPKNKSLSHLIHSYKNGDQNPIDHQNMFKKKKQHRTLSRSIHKSSLSTIKSPFDPENNTKQGVNKSLMVNSKSCGNSRKNSLYKKFIKNGIESKSNKLDFMSLTQKAKIFQPSKLRQSIIEGRKIQSEEDELMIQKRSGIKQRGLTSQNAELYVPKRTLEKENKQSKGLTKKTGNKKFTFASAIKDVNKIKPVNFLIQNRNSEDSQQQCNRKTFV